MCLLEILFILVFFGRSRLIFRYVLDSCTCKLGTGHCLSPAKWNLIDPPFECCFTEVIPPNNFWWFSRPPPPPYVFVFQANLSGSPSESFHKFQWSPLLDSQLRVIPPFVLTKIKWSPQKIVRPHPPQVINNDRSFQCGDKVTSFLCFFDPCSAYYLCIVPVIWFYYYYYYYFGQVRVCEARYIAWQTRIVIVNNTLAPFLCLLDIRMRVCPRCKPRVY